MIHGACRLIVHAVLDLELVLQVECQLPAHLAPVDVGQDPSAQLDQEDEGQGHGVEEHQFVGAAIQAAAAEHRCDDDNAAYAKEKR